MAEAVATLALASSILQVIDFGTKVASTAVKVYQASKRSAESSSEVSQLQDVYTKLSSTVETLQRDNSAATKDGGTDDMQELAKSCAMLAKELLDILHKIGLSEVRKKRHAVQVAVKLARKQDDIVSLQARIGEFRSQLTMCLLVSVRIADPHEGTFKWIFEKSSDRKWISLREWLESDDKLYWVTGIPDEFQGDPKELISMFQEMRSLPYNKLCVASRPWNEFKDAFDKQPSLMVEQLTRNDIKNFVAARFESDPRFAQLRSPELDQLIEDIVTKASGVFLWVSLVVSSLITGMGNGDRITDLRKRFDLLPPDLSKLYRRMIQSLDPFYLEHAAQLFALVGASRKPMDLLLASFVDEEDPQSALRMESKAMSDQQIDIRMDTMRRRINSRSRGLLEVKGGTHLSIPI
ncbi:hypothetical protein KJ359_005584 [Pestalotiopsis sp. 9143b]|nr:hypothetical protein KJ359_005584 [Pestalotiopsis sp. 9143b]